MGKETLIGVALGTLKRLSRPCSIDLTVRGADLDGARTPSSGLVNLFPPRLIGVVPTLDLLTLMLNVRVALTTTILRRTARDMYATAVACETAQ